MKMVVAQTAGFCMGVRRAVDMVLDAANIADGPIYTYGPLIHNPQVLDMLEKKNVHRLDDIPAKGDGVVLIRAHGVPPEDVKALEQAGFKVLDATCPRVTRVQVIINRYAKQGYATIIIGDEKHPEVAGLLGYARGNGHTVTSIEQMADLPKFESAVVVGQTTQNTAFYEEIKHWCTSNAPHYKVFDTICGSTERRQSEIRGLAEKSDAVVVIGGKQSGNTRRLAQIASQTGKPTMHIEEASEIDYSLLSSARELAVTAGASTPNWIINNVCRDIEQNLNHQHFFSSLLTRCRDFLSKTNILTAAGAGFLAYACSAVQGITADFIHALIALLYVLSMHVLNNLFTVKSDTYNHPERACFYRDHCSYLWILAVLSGAAGLYLSWLSSPLSFVLLLIMSLLGLSYNLRILPVKNRRSSMSRIRDLPGSKTILIVLAWGTVTCLLPAVVHPVGALSVACVFAFSTGLVFARSAFFDVLAIQGDRITGKETLPILMGEKKSIQLIRVVLFVCVGVMVLAPLAGILLKTACILALIPFMMLILIRFFIKSSLMSGAYRELILESCFIATGLLAALI